MVVVEMGQDDLPHVLGAPAERLDCAEDRRRGAGDAGIDDGQAGAPVPDVDLADLEGHRVHPGHNELWVHRRAPSQWCWIVRRRARVGLPTCDATPRPTARERTTPV